MIEQIRWLFPFDIKIPWFFQALSKCSKIIRQEDIQVIFTTSPSQNFILASLLKKKCNVPMVIDFADPWTQNPYYIMPTLKHKKYIEQFEEQICHLADGISYASTQQQQMSINKFNIDGKKTIWLPPSFDPDDFDSPIIPVKDSNKTQLLYLGTIYNDFPMNFLHALSSLIKDKKIEKEQIVLNFVGKIAPDNLRIIHEFKKDIPIIVHGNVNHDLALRWLKSADILLFWQSQIVTHFFPSRLPEYLRFYKSILLLTKKTSMTAKIMKDYPYCQITDDDDIDDIKRGILYILKKYREWNSQKNPDYSYINQFNLKNNSLKLSTFLRNQI